MVARYGSAPGGWIDDPNDPTFPDGEPLHLDTLRRMAELSGRVERASASGNMGCDVGPGGVVVYDQTPLERFVRTTAQSPGTGDDPPTHYYSWVSVRRVIDGSGNLAWETDDQGPSGTYERAEFPLVEINGNGSVTDPTVVRAWLSDKGDSLEFEYQSDAPDAGLAVKTWNGTTATSVVSAATELQVTTTNGLTVTNPSGTIARLDVQAAGTGQAGVVSTGTQTFQGSKTFSSVVTATGYTVTGSGVGGLLHDIDNSGVGLDSGIGVIWRGVTSLSVHDAGVLLRRWGGGSIAYGVMDGLTPAFGASGTNALGDRFVQGICLTVGSGTPVTAVSVTTANGISGSSSGGATPSLTFTLGAITPSSVNTVVISGSSSPSLAVTGTTTVSGANTGDQLTFKTISVSGQSDVVADSTTDTLTLVAGSNVTITTNAGTDTITIAASGGSGTVTSVGMTVPSILSVAGSPVTTSGTLAVTLATQAANTIFAGPTTGSAAAPTFRAMVTADIADGIVTTAKVADDAITYAKLQNVSATSRILGRKTASAGDAEECTLSEVLDFVGSAARGDILYRGASTWTRLPAGTSGQFLKTLGSGADPAWSATGGGDVAGPASSVDGEIALFDSTTGKLIKRATGTGVVKATAGVYSASALAVADLPALNGFTDAVPALDDIVPIYDTSAAANRDTRIDQILGLVGFEPGGRLTNTTGDPYGIAADASLSAGATLYYAPDKHNKILLWDGTSAVRCYTFTERSLTIDGVLSNDTLYDIFIYDSSGTLTLASTAWSSYTARATAVTMQNGFLCKSGSPTHRYLGTIYVTQNGSTEIALDHYSYRHIYNFYNQVTKHVACNIPAIPTWIYNSSTFRATNGTNAARVLVCNGWEKGAISLRAVATVVSGSGTLGNIGIGYNSTTGNTADTNGRAGAAAGTNAMIYAEMVRRPYAGLSYFQQLEATELGAVTFGSDGGTKLKTGMVGTWGC